MNIECISKSRLIPAVIFLAVVLNGCSETEDVNPTLNKPVEYARTVTTAQVELRPLSGRTIASGLLVPREEAAVGAEISGFLVADIYVDEGDIVEKGQALVQLDNTLLLDRIAQAKATLQQAEREENRAKNLDGTGVLSEEEIGHRRSQANIARAQLNDLNTQAERMTVKAPVSGLVLERNVRLGAVSSGGEVMFRIARDQLIELDAEVPENVLSSIEQGSAVKVTIPSGDSFDGVVRLISPRVDPQTKLGRVRVKLPVDSALRSGGFAQASFQSQQQPVASIPEKAIQFEAGGPIVTIVDNDNRAQRVSIRTGVRANGYVELIEGPTTGTRVALGGAAFLLDGDLVAPVANKAEQ